MQRRLDRLLQEEGPFECVIQGEARGADHLAALWALRSKIPLVCYPAEWSKHGKKAGPIRNKQMLEDGKPTIVVAFPGGRGTANMVKQAKAAGVRVVEIVRP